MDTSALLVLRKPRGPLRIEPFIEESDGKLVVPLQWFAMKRFDGAEVLDRHLRLSRVERANICGIAGPKVSGGFDFGYLLMVTFGWLTLAVPVLTRLVVAETRDLTLDDARKYIAGIVKSSRLDGTEKRALIGRIERAKTVSAMRRALDDARN